MNPHSLFPRMTLFMGSLGPFPGENLPGVVFKEEGLRRQKVVSHKGGGMAGVQHGVPNIQPGVPRVGSQGAPQPVQRPPRVVDFIHHQKAIEPFRQRRQRLSLGAMDRAAKEVAQVGGRHQSAAHHRQQGLG